MNDVLKREPQDSLFSNLNRETIKIISLRKGLFKFKIKFLKSE